MEWHLRRGDRPRRSGLEKDGSNFRDSLDRAGQTFEPDMEESGAQKKKKKKRICLPTYPYPKVMVRVWANWNTFKDGLTKSLSLVILMVKVVC